MAPFSLVDPYSRRKLEPHEGQLISSPTLIGAARPDYGNAVRESARDRPPRKPGATGPRGVLIRAQRAGSSTGKGHPAWGRDSGHARLLRCLGIDAQQRLAGRLLDFLALVLHDLLQTRHATFPPPP